MFLVVVSSSCCFFGNSEGGGVWRLLALALFGGGDMMQLVRETSKSREKFEEGGDMNRVIALVMVILSATLLVGCGATTQMPYDHILRLEGRVLQVSTEIHSYRFAGFLLTHSVVGFETERGEIMRLKFSGVEPRLATGMRVSILLSVDKDFYEESKTSAGMCFRDQSTVYRLVSIQRLDR